MGTDRCLRSSLDSSLSVVSPFFPHVFQPLLQGAAALGLRSKDFVVLAALKRSANELSSYQKKIFKVDDHIGIAISGLTADARSLAKCVVCVWDGWMGYGGLR